MFPQIETQMLDFIVNLEHLNSILYDSQFIETFAARKSITMGVKEFWHNPPL